MIDKTSALNVFQISEEEYNKLLEDFIIQALEKIGMIECSLKNNDTGTAFKEIHSLKGIAGNMRLDDFYSTIIEFETSLRSSSISFSFFIEKLNFCINEIKLSINEKKS
jgi:HPt (histidine-containing phosphotransfer) domain-containing protein